MAAMSALKLDHDAEATMVDRLQAHPLRWAVARAMGATAKAACPVVFRLALGELPGDPFRTVDTTIGGDLRKAPGVATHEHFLTALRASEAPKKSKRPRAAFARGK
jgi:hypothetical protein